MVECDRQVSVGLTPGSESVNGHAVPQRRLGISVIAASCGIAAGLLEVVALVIRKSTSGSDGFYRISRHFVWMIPLTYLTLFLVLGIGLSLVWSRLPLILKRLSFRFLGILTLCPALLVGFPQIYPVAWLLVALGIVEQSIPVLQRLGRQGSSVVRWSLAGMIMVVAVLMVWSFRAEVTKLWRSDSRPILSRSSPNVLLIVLDTVAADHLSLYGYGRRTSPTLERLSGRGVRFDAAYSTAPWTLMSHASIFTGMWPHETSAGWNRPLDNQYPTIAEFLSKQGYETSGFVANLFYCGYDSGLARGFTTYRDHRLTLLTGMASSRVGTYLFDCARSIRRYFLAPSKSRPPQFAPEATENRIAQESLKTSPPLRSSIGGSEPAVTIVGRLLEAIKNFRASRKDAVMVNEEFFHWLRQRDEPDRPFFTFLNYMDAHRPHMLPIENGRHFGMKAETAADTDVLSLPFGTRGLTGRDKQLLHDAYDDCIAFLDERLDALFKELERQDLLARTVVIITADHGESFGEHGLYGHGLTLYRPEIHVPLLILGGSRVPEGEVVSVAVSLRDIPATIVGLVDLEGASPFPGMSLARYWKTNTTTPSAAPPVPALAELDSPDPGNDQRLRSPAIGGPLASVISGDLVYTRNLKTEWEELYNWKQDSTESRNLADSPDFEKELIILRKTLNTIVNWPKVQQGRY